MAVLCFVAYYIVKYLSSVVEINLINTQFRLQVRATNMKSGKEFPKRIASLELEVRLARKENVDHTMALQSWLLRESGREIYKVER